MLGTNVSRAGFALAVIGVVAIGVALVLALGSWNAPSGTSNDTPTPAPAPTIDSAQTPTARPHAPRAPRAPVALPPSPADTGPSTQLRVVSADGRPLPGADVPHALSSQLRTATDVEARLREIGVVVQTDADGIARWPWRAIDGEWWRAAVRVGDDYGEVWLGTKADPSEVHELRMQRDRSVRVRVVDARGRPAVGVAMRADHRTEGRDAPVRRSVGTTDGEGRLTVRHLQLWTDRVAPIGGSRHFVLRVDLPAIDVAQSVDADAPSNDEILLTLPPSGSVEVDLRDASGAAPNAGRVVAMRPDDDGNDAAAAVWNARSDLDGRAAFPFVGLGRTFRIVGLDGHVERFRLADDAVSFVGPRAGDEIVRVELRPRVVLIGQLRDADGAPAVGVRVLVLDRRIPLAPTPVQTDAEGRFVAAVDGAGGRRVTSLGLACVDAGGDFDGCVARWRGDLTLTSGEHDLSVLTLAAEPIVVAGRMHVRGGGAPEPWPVLFVEAATGDEAQPWRGVPLLARNGADGAFAFFGETPVAALRLNVETERRYVPVAPIPFVAGARDLAIELRRGGSVTASVVVGTQLVDHCVRPVLLSMDGVGDAVVPDKHEWIGDAPIVTEYTWPAVTPGRYRLVVRARGVTAPLREVHDVVVVDGERNADARMQRMTLPEVKVVELRFPQVARLPARTGMDCAIFVLDGDAPTRECTVTSEIAWFVSTRPLDFLVRIDGYRDRVLRGVFENRVVECEPAIAVTLRCEGAVAAGAGDAWTFTLTPIDDPLTMAGVRVYAPAIGESMPHQPSYRSPAISAPLVDGVATFGVPAAGRYRVRATREVEVVPDVLTIGADGGAFVVRVRE